jgi:hypothetical protein
MCQNTGGVFLESIHQPNTRQAKQRMRQKSVTCSAHIFTRFFSGLLFKLLTISLVGELLWGDGCGSPNHTQFLAIFFLFIVLFIQFIRDIKKECCIQLNN